MSLISWVWPLWNVAESKEVILCWVSGHSGIRPSLLLGIGLLSKLWWWTQWLSQLSWVSVPAVAAEEFVQTEAARQCQSQKWSYLTTTLPILLLTVGRLVQNMGLLLGLVIGDWGLGIIDFARAARAKAVFWFQISDWSHYIDESMCSMCQSFVHQGGSGPKTEWCISRHNPSSQPAIQSNHPIPCVFCFCKNEGIELGWRCTWSTQTLGSNSQLKFGSWSTVPWIAASCRWKKAALCQWGRHRLWQWVVKMAQWWWMGDLQLCQARGQQRRWRLKRPGWCSRPSWAMRSSRSRHPHWTAGMRCMVGGSSGTTERHGRGDFIPCTGERELQSLLTWSPTGWPFSSTVKGSAGSGWANGWTRHGAHQVPGLGTRFSSTEMPCKVVNYVMVAVVAVMKFSHQFDHQFRWLQASSRPATACAKMEHHAESVILSLS